MNTKIRELKHRNEYSNHTHIIHNTLLFRYNKYHAVPNPDIRQNEAK